MRGRITFCGSGIYALARLKEIDGENQLDIIKALDDPSRADMAYRYMTTKLLLIYFVQGLADALPLENFNPVINYTMPGFARSNIVRKELGVVQRLLGGMITLCLARSTECGR